MDRSEDGAASGDGVGWPVCVSAALRPRLGGRGIHTSREKREGEDRKRGDVWELALTGGALTGGAHASSRV
jgi:hypothetical protein